MQEVFCFVFKRLFLVILMFHPFTRYLLLLLVSACSLVKAQQYNFKNYSAESGLPFVQISCMHQDKKGYIWSGGYGGLSRFDGKVFLNFSPKNGLSSQYVNAICSNDSNHIFVATADGLSVIKKKKISNYNSNKIFSTAYLTALCYDKNTGVYVGSRQGLYVFNNHKFQEITNYKGMEIKSLFCTKNGVICVGTTFGLFYYDPNKKTSVKQQGLAGENINCITECADNGHLFIGTSNGLSKIILPGQTPTNLHVENGLIDENIKAVFCENKDEFWIGSAAGLLKYDGKVFEYYNLFNDNNANHIRCILKDTEENIWVGTHSGVYKYRDNAFSSFDKSTGIGNAFVFKILKDKQGDIWFCTDGSGVFKYSKGFFKNYTTKDGLLHNSAISATLMDDGSIWFGTPKGFSIFRNNRFENFSGNAGMQVKGPMSVQYVDSKNTLWMGGQNGAEAIRKINGVYKTQFYKIPELLLESGVQALVEDKDGGLWLGTFLGGLFKLEGDEFVYQNKKRNIKAESFFTLLCDKNNVLYGATLNGLWIYDLKTGTQQYITDKDGLNSELTYLLHFSDNENTLWVGTNQGINKFDLGGFRENKTIKIQSYGKTEGFTGVECNNYGVLEEEDGTFWFGTVSGVVRHQPQSININSKLPLTYIQSIKLLSEDTLLKNGSLLPHDYNNITFYYRGICFTNPDKVLYKKKLEGYENNWSEPSNEDYSKYANLPAGKYTFKVKSCNNEGIWNEVPAEFSFEIKLPFYKTWWFILAMLALSSALIIAVFQIRVQNIRKKEKAEFDKKVEIAKVELKALRAQMNPHFVFNSLNSIQHYILNSKSNEAAKYLNKFAKLIRTILSNSEKAMVTVNEDVESLRLYLELEQMRFDDKFDYSINVDASIDGDYDEIPPMLMQPYIENAILHGLNPKETKGHLKIDIFTKNNYIVCRISDDGIGREKSGEIKRTSPSNPHKSLGMKITSERVRILNNINKSDLSVSVTDLKDEQGNSCGTMVELYIPHFN